MLEWIRKWLFGENKKKEKEPKKFDGYLGRRKVLKVGNSRAISLPDEWFKAHDIDPNELKDLTVVADDDIKIYHPKNEGEAKKKIDELTGD